MAVEIKRGEHGDATGASRQSLRWLERRRAEGHSARGFELVERRARAEIGDMVHAGREREERATFCARNGGLHSMVHDRRCRGAPLHCADNRSTGGLGRPVGGTRVGTRIF